jgi:Ni,Fe-hydrogenase III large subunit
MILEAILGCIAIQVLTELIAAGFGRAAFAGVAVYGATFTACVIIVALAFPELAAEDASAAALVLPLGIPWVGAHFRLDALAAFAPGGSDSIRQLVVEIRQRWAELVTIYDNTASLQDRTVGAGILRPEFAALFSCGGFVGRASGRAVDARRRPGYPPYDELSFEIPVRQEGDVDARIWIRIREVEQSLALIEQILDGLPAGPVRTEFHPGHSQAPREGMALVEGFRGDILVWVRLRPDGTIDRCHPRDPSWFQWPLLEAAIEGNIVADFPLCNKSFNCSYSGHDL